MSNSQNISLISSENTAVHAIENVDRISHLPNDLLLKIFSELSTEEVIRTSILSKRWRHAWKKISIIFFDMRNVLTINGIVLPKLLDRAAKLITKVLNNHNGDLETCTIFHYSYQCEDETLDSWIHSLTNVKHTKNLILANFNGRLVPTIEGNVLKLSTKRFSHPDLTTLSMYQYILHDAHAFNSCLNLKKLELYYIFAEVDVFNKVISSCPSLEVLILQIVFYNSNGSLKIDHKRLRVLYMSCNQIDDIEVCAAHLDILSIQSILCESDNVVLTIPRLQFGRNYWNAGKIFPHTSVNISYTQENKINMMVKGPLNYIRQHASLSVSVDLKNPQEVEVLWKTLDMWTVKMIELEILFKNNNSLEEEGESSNNGAEHTLWETPFVNDDFRVDTLWMHNFSGSNREEFMLASRFVMQKTVMKKIMIKTSSFFEMKKIKIEEAVAKLNKLPKGNEELSIECF